MHWGGYPYAPFFWDCFSTSFLLLLHSVFSSSASEENGLFLYIFGLVMFLGMAVLFFFFVGSTYYLLLYLHTRYNCLLMYCILTCSLYDSIGSGRMDRWMDRWIERTEGEVEVVGTCGAVYCM